MNRRPDPQLEGTMAAAEEVMNQVQQVDNHAKHLQQEAMNKAHDTEFSVPQEGPIGKDQVAEAYQTLLQYKRGKVDFEQRVQENEKMWKLGQWELMQKIPDQRIKPVTAHAVNVILNKHADFMDNYPEPNILPRTIDDKETAEVLSKVVPVIMEQNNYEQTYSDTGWYLMKFGAMCTGVFWDNDLSNGLGDVSIEKVDMMDLFWKPGIADIQQSPNIFYVTYMENEEIKARYPQLKETSDNPELNTGAVYQTGDDEEISKMSPVIDWYYRKRIQELDMDGIPQTRTVLHYCKFCNGEVLYASENDPEYAEQGWYEDGNYPFVVTQLYPMEKNVVGFGYMDIVKHDQFFIDKMGQAIIENALANARPRYAVKEDGGLNEQDFADFSKPIIKFHGTLGENDFRQITCQPLPGIYENVYQGRINQLKETSGNTAASQGQISQVTAASGIASLQEAAGKLSRDSNAAAYRGFKKIVELVIERIRQFYTEPRCFRISGDGSLEENYVTNFDNSGLLPQQETAFGLDLGARIPIMDVKVKPQKRSQYSKEAQNQTALNLYQMGFFSPDNMDSALACLDMMDFDGIEEVRKKIVENGMKYQQMMMMAQMMAPQMTQGDTNGNKPTESKGSLSSQAANATRESTAPR